MNGEQKYTGHDAVVAGAVSISLAQVQRFAAAVGENARPVQPVNKRFVLAPLAAAK